MSAVTSGRTNTNQISHTTFYVKWDQSSQSIANNETTINWEAGINNGNWDRYYSNAVKIYNVYINGTLVSNGGTWSNINPSSSDIGLLSGTFTIPHNADGTKTFNVSISAWTYSSSYYDGNSDFELTPIPRKATITNAPDFNDEENPTITYNNSAGNNVTSLEACISLSDTDDIPYRAISKTGNSYTFNLTSAERDTIYSLSRIYKQMTATFIIKTVIGGNTYYDYSYKKVSIINANPTIETKAYEDTNATTLAVTSNNQLIIQNKSTLEFDFTNLEFYKKAYPIEISININGITKTESLLYEPVVDNKIASYTFNYGIVNVSENINAAITLKDSRNNTTTYSMPITMLEYYDPTAIINVYRDSNYYTSSVINVDSDYAYLDGLNTIDIKYCYKKTEDVSWGNWISLTDSTDYNFNADNQYAWDVKVQLEDILGTTKTYTIIKALDVGIPIVFYDIDKRSVGINCLPTHNESLEIRGKQIIDFIYPVGAIYMSVNSTNPSTIFGGTWEQIKDKFLLSSGDTYSAGATGGEATHTLTTDEMPSHNHTGTTDGGGGHSHSIPSTYYAYMNGSGGSFTGGSGDPYGANTGYENNHTHTFTTSSNGNGAAHNNMPPYLVVYVWKRTA